jgi:hypothetical protein
MTFTTPCFVRVENPEKRNNLREWAKNIGYNFVDVAGIESDYSDPQPYIEVFPHSFRSTTPQGNSFYVASRKAIDCGENTELLKALAAMNDENDREQWFTDGYHFELCPTNKADMVAWHMMYRTKPRKATAEEIVEYFKNNEK